MTSKLSLRLTFAVLCSALLPLNLFAQTSGLSAKVQRLVETLAPSINVAVVDLRTGNAIYQHRAQDQVKPASILKTITSSVALSILGPDYHFKTGFLSDSGIGKGGVVSTLYVRGGGDPSLTIEDALMAARRLHRLGVRKVGRIVVDDSIFDGFKARVGERAYEAGASGLAFNFNTLGFDICSTEVGRPALVIPDPNELPVDITGRIMTVSKKKAYYRIDDESRTMGGLTFSLKGEIRKTGGCETIYRSIDNPAEYFGLTMAGLLSKFGISVDRKALSRGVVPQGARTIFEHSSKPLSQIVWDLNHYSTNMIAEQLLYHVGFSRSGRLSRDAGLQRLGMYLEKLGFPSTSFELYDGSGLNHGNRVTAGIMVAVLRDIYKNQTIWPEFEASLAVMGRSGTLRKRMRGLRGGVVRAKTGSLNGVSSLAGYVFADTGARYAFVSIANGSAVIRARRFEEELVKALLVGH